MRYRAEIDGLRALAVVPVILFHAGFEVFGGGFVGVDVFFVISGYLITTILIEDIEKKRFSIINFYERRARRILPALFFMMLICIPFALIWMLPNQIRDFSSSLVAVSLFVSNFLFWSQSGYFAEVAEEKPLLHTWSLAVEEQYYVLFPIFLILAWRFGKNKVFWIIIFMASISLLLSEWGWRNKALANFYLAPTRAWELFAGSITTFIIQKRGVQKNNVLALIGLAAIIFSIFAYNETTPFPSLYTLVPVLGVVLLILFANKQTLVAKLLSTKAFVGIGLISYSVYLWHQPLFAFAKLEMLTEPTANLLLTLSLVSIVIGYLSWRYVEKPFRKSGVLSRKSIFVLSIIGILFFTIFGAMLTKQTEIEIRKIQKPFQNLFYDKEYISLRDMTWRAKEELITSNWSNCILDITSRLDPSKITHLNPDNINCEYTNIIFLFGDSHSRDIYQVLGKKTDLLKPGLLILSAHMGGCRIGETNKPHCVSHYERVKKFLSTSKLSVDTIIYVQAVRSLQPPKHEEDMLDKLTELQPFVKKIVWLGPRSGPGLSRNEIAQLCSSKVNSTKKDNLLEKFQLTIEDGIALDSRLKVQPMGKIKYISQNNLLELNSNDISLLTDCNEIFWSDEDHLSTFGEVLFHKKYFDFFHKINRQ